MTSNSAEEVLGCGSAGPSRFGRSAMTRVAPSQSNEAGSSNPAFLLLVLLGVAVSLVGFFLTSPDEIQFFGDRNVKGLINAYADHAHSMREPRVYWLLGTYVWWLIPILAGLVAVDSIVNALRGSGGAIRRPAGFALLAGTLMVATNFAGFAFVLVAVEQWSSIFFLPVTGFWESALAFPVMAIGSVLILVGGLVGRH